MDGDRLRLPANRNCYRLSRVSWALLKFCLIIISQMSVVLCTLQCFLSDASLVKNWTIRILFISNDFWRSVMWSIVNFCSMLHCRFVPAWICHEWFCRRLFWNLDHFLTSSRTITTMQICCLSKCLFAYFVIFVINLHRMDISAAPSSKKSTVV